MRSDFSNSSYHHNVDGSKNRLKVMIDELMPRLHSSWKHILLKDSQSEMTGGEVARTLLQECGRTDVKVCLSQNERNCYSPFLNLIGLSEDVMGSRSVIAAAIAAHEIGHALQRPTLEKLGRSLRNSPFYYLSIYGNLIILVPLILKILSPFIQESKSIQMSKSPAQNPDSMRNYQIYQLLKKSKRSRFINPQHLLHLVITLVEWGANLLRLLLHLIITLVKWGFNLLLLPISLLISVVYLGFLLLSVFCALICRLLLVLTELHASWWALRLLKQYKILGIHERRAARKFLLAAALTYLRSYRIDSLFA
jgi:hypothetical protein